MQKKKEYTRTQWDVDPRSSALAQSVLADCFHYLGSLEAPNPTSHQVPRVYCHSPISWYKEPCLASTWGGFRGAGVSIFMISSQHCFHWPEGRALIGGGQRRAGLRGPSCPLFCYIPFHTFLKQRLMVKITNSNSSQRFNPVPSSYSCQRKAATELPSSSAGLPDSQSEGCVSLRPPHTGY